MQVQILKKLIPAAIVVGLQKFDLEKAGLVNHCRCVFFLAQAVCVCICLILRKQILSSEETGKKVHVPAVTSLGQEVTAATVMTVPEYDLSKWREQIQQLVIGASVCYGIHYKWGFVTPMVIQIFMSPMNMLDTPLAKVYIFSKVAKGDLIRPWPTPNPFGLQGTSLTAKEKKQELKKAGKKSK
eukprot:TRINITY_DN51917_c0_g1_i1.p1 TRINITY_DN51917_c0_g1~~TRINITY_DN51917_c0_g1_i1.p1  ORF type:complete len:184 (-),score=41.28 TRINITY_DN51917_c0_g1_i1:113-664(-)